MGVALETTVFQAVDFTTLAVVKGEIDATTTSTANDPEITRAITDVSMEMTRYLGFHTLIATRTDIYTLRHGKRVLTLDARPVTADPSSLLIAVHPDDLATATEVPSADYVLHRQAGYIKFSGRMSATTAHVQVVYSGGLAATAADMVTNYPEFSRACSMQVKYLMARRESMGGNVSTIPGAATTFNGQYNLLTHVRGVLDAHRRQAV